MFFNSKVKPPQLPSKYIAIEGADTEAVEQQIHLLQEFLAKNNIESELITFPLFSGDIKKYADKHTPAKGNEYLTALYLAMDHMDAAGQLSKTLKSGKTILATGGLVHTYLHLAPAFGAPNEAQSFLKWLEHTHYTVCKAIRPDLTLILTNPKAESHPLAVQSSLLLPNSKLITQTGSPEDIHNVIWELVRRIAFKPVKTEPV